MKIYDHQSIEPKWQHKWSEARVFATPAAPKSEKAYILDMFPYPSGSGLHVGHLLGYTGSDVLARVARMQGKSVLHPMGWDAFGLPAENYAIKTGVHPAISTDKNTTEFKRQFTQVGISYDWDKELNTSQTEYYKWTQWLFELLYKRGLAYRKEGMVNWCPSCQTVLANEQVVQGECERCGSTVEKRMLKQWYFKITDYADRLLSDLDTLDWPEKIKTMQRNWIGRSEGAEVSFGIENSGDQVKIFTTRVDTLYGCTFLVLAPEHPLVEKITSPDQKEAVTTYIEAASKKNELQRTALEKEISGVSTGAFAIHPISGERVPIWIADFVLAHYGSGAVFADAHDERDFVFAKKYGIPLTPTIRPADMSDDSAIRNLETCFTGDGILYDSGEFSGQNSVDARKNITAWLESQGKGKSVVQYRLRDWLVSRQRFWGAPIPIMYDASGQEHLVPEDQLPVVLPMNVAFNPTGQSPLVHAHEWKTVRRDGESYMREVDTLDTFVCSSWYYLRFPNPHYANGPFDPEGIASWLPVDTYIGGAEHAVLHLLYARFFTKVLFDAGYLHFQEPFLSLRTIGVILGPDHAKMSKSKGNVINPDDIIKEHGADTLRLYEMFMAPFDQEKPWNTQGIVGVRRFLEKVWRLQERIHEQSASAEELRALHAAIVRCSEDITECKFNTAVSTLMETCNTLLDLPGIQKETYTTLLRLLSPLAPHVTEELWETLGMEGFCSMATWPIHNPEYLQTTSVEYPVQVNGKVRAKLHLDPALSQEQVQVLALADPKVQEWISGKEIRKVIVVPQRLVSIVV
jgi:leucyl-tRNA synthetase